MSQQKRTLAAAAAAAVLPLGISAVVPPKALADEGAAFVGGLMAGHVITNMANQSERRTRAAEHEAYQKNQQQQQAPAQSREATIEERLDTLDKLAAKGVISKEEYERRRQAILDDI